MNLGDFMRSLQDELVAPKRDVEIDPFDGLAHLIDEMGGAVELVRHNIGIIVDARERRNMAAMYSASQDLPRVCEQLRIMAETLMRVTATHKARGVK